MSSARLFFDRLRHVQQLSLDLLVNSLDLWVKNSRLSTHESDRIFNSDRDQTFRAIDLEIRSDFIYDFSVESRFEFHYVEK